jgi:hypothetical protein
MNIFVLDYDPVKAAQMQCDKHVVKMPLETAQVLCTAFPKGKAPYKLTHFNHPCSIWCRESRENYNWLIEHGLALCDEYTYRYGKNHKSREVILWCEKNMNSIHFKKDRKTHFVLCFDNKFKIGNAVQSYRYYYNQEKQKITQWNKSRSRPRWFTPY